MESNNQRSKRVRELPELAVTESRGGVLVRVRCFEVCSPEPARYEILLEGHGQYAIADVRHDQRDQLSARIDAAVDGFVGAVHLRAGLFPS